VDISHVAFAFQLPDAALRNFSVEAGTVTERLSIPIPCPLVLPPLPVYDQRKKILDPLAMDNPVIVNDFEVVAGGLDTVVLLASAANDWSPAVCAIQVLPSVLMKKFMSNAREPERYFSMS
jgi:hypothetical protein